MIAVAIAGLAATASAQAVISGTVANTAGVPLDSVYVQLRTSASDTFVDSDYTDENGAFSMPTPGTPGPYTIKLNESDSCRAYNDPAYTQMLAVPGINDPRTGLALTLDVRDFCAGSPPFSNPPPPEPTGIVDGAARRTVIPPGGVVYMKVRIPSGAVDPRVLLQDGTRISQPVTSSSSSLQVTAPAAGYNGPLSLVFGTSGGTITRTLGTLVSQAFGSVRPSPGVPYDVEAIVDISGSMQGTDPKFLRKDALNLLADLSGTADGLGAVGFDNMYQAIFDLTTTASQAVINLFKARVKTQVINRGSTDYNIGMDKAWEAMNAPGVDPNKPKLVIFLTDGAHNAGNYENGHLRFAYPGLFNGVTQRPWPVCAVQLGPPASFNAVDVARLKRIAADTGGKYFATQSSAALSNIYFKCRGQSTGQKAILTKSFVFSKKGQQKQFRRRLAKRLRQVTFFVNTGGTFVPQVSLLTPAGKVISQATRKKGIVFRRGGTFAFFRITKPAGGNWRVIVRVVRLTDPSGRGQVSITVPAK